MQQLGDTPLDVVENLFATFLQLKMLAKQLNVQLQFFIGGLLDRNRPSAEIDLNDLFHTID